MSPATHEVKILRLIARLNTGGPAIHTILLTQGLNGGRFCSRLITGVVGLNEGDMTYYAKARGVKPIVIPELKRDISLGNDLRSLWKIFRLFCREKPDIIHTHTAKAGGLGRVAGILYNASRIFSRHRQKSKLVHSFHGHIFHGYFPPLRSRLLVLIERLLARGTDRIIAVSDNIKRELVEVYKVCGAAKVAVVPVGLDFGWADEIPRHRGTLRRQFSIPADYVLIGIVGRLTEIKNHRLFLSAIRALASKKVRAFVIGDGELYAEIVKIARELDLSERVVFTGWQQEPPKIYADLDIVCLTSRNEGTPVVLMEAMAAGLPFVTTDVGGVRDLVIGKGTIHPGKFEVFDNGILTPQDNPVSLAAALEFLIHHPERRREIGASGRRWVFGKYSYNRLLEDMARLYADLQPETFGGIAEKGGTNNSTPTTLDGGLRIP